MNLTLTNEVDIVELKFEWTLYVSYGDTVGPYVQTTPPDAEQYHKIYVTLDTPEPPMNPPHLDILEISCDKAKGEGYTEWGVKTALLHGVYQYLDEELDYNAWEVHVTYNLFYQGNFNLSEFLDDGKGDCEDAACFYEICCAAQGITMYQNRVWDKQEPAEFLTTYLDPFGPTNGMNEYVFPFHQFCVTDWIYPGIGDPVGIVWDPTCKFLMSPIYVEGMVAVPDYRNHLVDIPWNEDLDWSIFQYSVTEVQ